MRSGQRHWRLEQGRRGGRRGGVVRLCHRVGHGRRCRRRCQRNGRRRRRRAWRRPGLGLDGGLLGSRDRRGRHRGGDRLRCRRCRGFGHGRRVVRCFGRGSSRLPWRLGGRPLAHRRQCDRHHRCRGGPGQRRPVAEGGEADRRAAHQHDHRQPPRSRPRRRRQRRRDGNPRRHRHAARVELVQHRIDDAHRGAPYDSAARRSRESRAAAHAWCQRRGARRRRRRASNPCERGCWRAAARRRWRAASASVRPARRLRGRASRRPSCGGAGSGGIRAHRAASSAPRTRSGSPASGTRAAPAWRRVPAGRTARSGSACVFPVSRLESRRSVSSVASGMVCASSMHSTAVLSCSAKSSRRRLMALDDVRVVIAAAIRQRPAPRPPPAAGRAASSCGLGM